MTLPDDLFEPTTPANLGAAVPRKHRHDWAAMTLEIVGDPRPVLMCARCGKVRDETHARRGRQSRNYGNRAELAIARTYGGTKVGHAGGPVDVRGKEFSTQVKTHRRLPPLEWRKAFAAMNQSSGVPRLLLRFLPGVGLQPEDYVVIPGKAWLDWFGRDE